MCDYSCDEQGGLTFKFVNEALMCYHSTESIWAALSHCSAVSNLCKQKLVKISTLMTIGGKGLVIRIK